MPQCGEDGRQGEGLKNSTGLQKTLFVPVIGSSARRRSFCAFTLVRGGSWSGPDVAQSNAARGPITMFGGSARLADPRSSAHPAPPRPMATVTVTRRMTFNAAHRVHNPALSDEENRTLFGK